MFGVSLTELIVVFLVALVLFGPEKLPEMARQFGKLMGELKKASDSVRKEFYNSVYPPGGLGQDLQNEVRQLRALKAELLSPPPGTRPVVEAKPAISIDSATKAPEGSVDSPSTIAPSPAIPGTEQSSTTDAPPITDVEKEHNE